MKKHIIIISIVLISLLIIIAGLVFWQTCFGNKEFIVTFDSIVGSQVESQIIKRGDKIAKPEEPQKYDYTFGGWYKSNSDFSNENLWNFENDKVKNDITLYARWLNFTPGLQFNLIDDNKAYEVSVGTAAALGYTQIKIPEEYNAKPVTKIADDGFRDDFYGLNDGVRTNNITGITIPDTITIIGREAFLGCSSLKSITIPGNVDTIGGESFKNCHSLSSVIIEEGVKNIKYDAFRRCTSLTSIIIPSSMLNIEESAFEDITLFKEVYLLRTSEHGSLTKAGYRAFGSNIEKIYVYDSLYLTSYWTQNSYSEYIAVLAN